MQFKGLESVFQGIKSKIMSQQVEIEEKTKHIQLLNLKLKKSAESIQDQESQW